MLSIMKQYFRSNKGATAIEYGLIAALIAVVCIGALAAVGTSLNAKFTAVQNNLT